MNQILLVAIGAVLGGVIGFFWVRSRGQDERVNAAKLEAEKTEAQNQRAALQEENDKLEASLTSVNGQLNDSKRDNAVLQNEMQAKEKSIGLLSEQFEKSKNQLTQEFENLANKIFEEKDKAFSKESKTTLENLLKPFGIQINDFQNRVNEVHTQSTKSNAAMQTEIQHIVQSSNQISNEATNLAKALKGNIKTTGDWGEDNLEMTLQLSGLEKGHHYEKEKSFRDKSGNMKRLDFTLKLPDGKHIIIDSKASVVGYTAAVTAETEEQRNLAMKAPIAAIRNHIDALSKKEYDQLEGIDSPGFVLMFLPLEPAYLEAMNHDRGLFNYGYRKNIVMVSHTTLLPLLHTIKNLWQLARGNDEAREISDKAGDIFNTLCLVAERLKDLGGSLNTTVGHYNSALTSFAGQQGLHGKVERFKELSAKVNKTFPEISRLHKDIETRRLENIKAITPPSDDT